MEEGERGNLRRRRVLERGVWKEGHIIYIYGEEMREGGRREGLVMGREKVK